MRCLVSYIGTSLTILILHLSSILPALSGLVGYKNLESVDKASHLLYKEDSPNK